MSDSKIVKTIFLKADAETVWRFLTDKDKLGQWFFSADSDLTARSDYVLQGEADDGSKVRKCWGSVLELDRPNKLVYTFTIEPLGGAMTTVTWRLEQVHGGTRLMLEHEGIDAAAGDSALSLLMALDGGWDAHLDRLRGVAN